MNKKLTLLLDEAVINHAKEYAEHHKETLSGIVEKYFRYLTVKNPGKAGTKISREIEDITGIVKLPENLDVKKEYRQHRAEKILNE